MQGVANQFVSNMRAMRRSLELAKQITAFGGQSDPPPSGISWNPEAQNLRTSVQAAHPAFIHVVFEGLYLSACASYELTIRQLIERYVEEVSEKLKDFSKFPKPMREWYLVGISDIVTQLHREKFQHLTQAHIYSSIAACAKPAWPTPPQLITDAFSNNDRNLRADVISEFFARRLAIDKVWQKLARDATFQSYIGSNHPDTAEKLAKEQLNQHMTRRNNIIHRGRNFYAPSESDIISATEYFAALVSALTAMLVAQCAAL
jgi:hypothetical protein